MPRSWHAEQEELENSPVVSQHTKPQVSPQEWDCGCVTAVYVTDSSYVPFEMRLWKICDKPGCAAVREAAVLTVDLREHGTYNEGDDWTAHFPYLYDIEEDRIRGLDT